MKYFQLFCAILLLLLSYFSTIYSQNTQSPTASPTPTASFTPSSTLTASFTPTPSPSTSPLASILPPPSTDTGIDTQENFFIVLAIAGGVTVIIIVSVLAYFVYIRWSRRRLNNVIIQ